MKNKGKVFVPLGVLVLGVVLAALLVQARPTPEGQEAPRTPPLVRVVEVVRQDLPLVVRSQGTVEPRTRTTLVAEVAGRVLEVSSRFAEGAFVDAGELLLRIDPRDHELALAQATAEVARARLRLTQEEAEAAVRREEWQAAGQGEEGSPLALREPQLAEARAALEAAEATVERLRRDLARTVVRAPYDARIQSKAVDVGQFVAPGTPLGTLFAVDLAEVRLPVPKEELAYLGLPLGPSSHHRGPAPEVTLRARLGDLEGRWTGRIVRTSGEIDPRTRMLHLIAQVEDPFGRRRGGSEPPLLMGLFVQAEIQGETAEGVVVLPRSALRGEDQVLVVDGESRLRFRPVQVLRLEGEQAVIRDGLAPGERVCVSPLEVVVEGMEVRTVGEEAETPALQGGGA